MPGPARLVLLGHPVAHSLSPRMQGAALRAAGIDATYEAVDVPPGELERVVSELRGSNGAGNVTIPHKQRMAELCDRRTEVAASAGAVNAFWMEGSTLVGDNTDVAGFDAAVRLLVGVHPLPRRVALVGAGGAAAAVAIATRAWLGSELLVWARRGVAAEAFARRFAHARAAATPREALAGADLVVNATPVGLHDDALPFPLDALDPGAAVLDLVYGIGETALVRAAGAAGHRACDGLAMLVEQGAAAFVTWFGIEPDRSVMWRALGREMPGAR